MPLNAIQECTFATLKGGVPNRVYKVQIHSRITIPNIIFIITPCKQHASRGSFDILKRYKHH